MTAVDGNYARSQLREVIEHKNHVNTKESRFLFLLFACKRKSKGKGKEGNKGFSPVTIASSMFCIMFL